METAIAQSCDVYFYDLANMLGVDKLSDFLAHFGLGSYTGIDIGGERRGILPSRDWKKAYFKDPADQVWFPGETVIFGIGQGYLLVTPMQLAHMTSIVASRGKSYQPRLVTAFREQGTGKLEPIAPKLLETIEVASPENWKIAIDGMVRVMNGGTGSRSQAGAEYQIAGKTGTAQVFTVKQNERYRRGQARRAPARSRLVHRVRAGRLPEDRRRRDHRERQAWHRGRADRAPRARPVPARPHDHARDSTARSDRGWHRGAPAVPAGDE